jgi:hemolysin III
MCAALAQAFFPAERAGRMEQSDDRRWELANALTHGAGVVAALAGGVVLIVFSALYGGTREILTSAVFSLTMVLLYTASTLYHAARTPALKARLKVFDHCAIYLLIAGSYTPVTLLGLRGGWGWSLFGVAWGLAVAGVVFKLFFTGRFPRVSTAIYVGMGWMAMVAIGPMLERLSTATLAWLIAGGLTYTAGTVFYHNRRPYAHAVWHLFVLGGSICHFAAVLTQVLPPGPT